MCGSSDVRGKNGLIGCLLQNYCPTGSQAGRNSLVVDTVQGEPLPRTRPHLTWSNLEKSRYIEERHFQS